MSTEAYLGTRAQQGFIFTIVLQAIIVVTMVAIGFGLVEANVDTSGSRYKTLPCYFAMFGLAEIFELLLALDALKLQNIIQLVGILIFHIGLLVFSVLQIRQTHTSLVVDSQGNDCSGTGYQTCSGPGSLFDLVEKFLIVVPSVLGAALLVMTYFVRQLFNEFGWAVFHVVGADPRMKEMYQFYQIMICLLKFDAFCFVGLTMQLLIVVLNTDSVEFGLTIAAIPIVLLLLVGCGIAVKRELKWLMTASLVLLLGAQAYFLYKFSRLFVGVTREQYVSTRSTLACFSIVSFIMVFATFAVGLRCFADFDRGLKPSKTNEGAPIGRPSKFMVDQSGTPVVDNRGSYMLSPRMSIE